MKIKSMNLRGGDRNVVIRASGGLFYKEPQVSPDGRWVVFLSEKSLGVVNGVEQNRKALKVVRMNGTHVHKIVPYRLDVCACGGDWSPNGKWIEFSESPLQRLLFPERPLDSLSHRQERGEAPPFEDPSRWGRRDADRPIQALARHA